MASCSYGCESWTVKKAERRRIDAFELWCWRRLESPLDCKEVQPVHPKGDQSWVLMEGLMLKLKLQYFGHLMQRVDSLGKPLMLGGTGGRRRRGRHRMRWLNDAHEFGWTLGVGDGQGGLACCNSWGCKVGHDWVTVLNWTELKCTILAILDMDSDSNFNKT